MRNDAKQERLRALFEELRRIRRALNADQGDPVVQVYHDERVRSAIRRIEGEIERVMNSD